MNDVSRIKDELYAFIQEKQSNLDILEQNEIERVQNMLDALEPNSIDINRITNQMQEINKKYTERRKDLQNLLSAVHRIEVLGMNPSELQNTDKIASAMDTVSENFSQNSELKDNKEVSQDHKKINVAYSTDLKKIAAEKKKEIEEAVETALEAAAKAGCLNNKISSNATVSVEDKIRSFGEAVTNTFTSKSSSEYKSEAMPSDDTKHKLEELEEYEEKVRLGQMKPVNREKPVFFAKLGFKPVSAVITGKDTLLKISSIERKMDSLDKALKVIISSGKQSEYAKTYETLQKLKEKYKALLVKAQEEFKKSDYHLVEDALKTQKESEAKAASIEHYANVYANLEETLAKKPSDKEKIAYLESMLADIAIRSKLSKDDVWLAKQKGKEIYDNRVAMEKIAEKDKIKEKEHSVQSDIDLSNREAKLREAISRQMALEGWKPKENVMKGADTDFVESSRLWEEEVSRRLKEQLFSAATIAPTKDSNETTKVDYHDNLQAAEENLQSIVADRLALDSNGKVVTSSDIKETVDYYKATANMTREERALITLKKEGLIPSVATLETLTLPQKESLNAQMRLEASIGTALEEFAKAKKEYDEYMDSQRLEQISYLTHNNSHLSK